MKRKAIPKSLRREIGERSGGLCESEGCVNPARDYEHRIPVALGGENTAENLWHACKECHREKTSNEDIPRIAKAKRQAGEKGQRARRMKAKAQGKHRPIQSRGFQTNKDAPFKKKFNGEVEKR